MDRQVTPSLMRGRHEVDPREIAFVLKEMFYLTTHSTHYIYGYIASDMW